MLACGALGYNDMKTLILSPEMREELNLLLLDELQGYLCVPKEWVAPPTYRLGLLDAEAPNVWVRETQRGMESRGI